MINHTTGERFDNIEVKAEDSPLLRSKTTAETLVGQNQPGTASSDSDADQYNQNGPAHSFAVSLPECDIFAEPATSKDEFTARAVDCLSEGEDAVDVTVDVYYPDTLPDKMALHCAGGGVIGALEGSVAGPAGPVVSGLVGCGLAAAIPYAEAGIDGALGIDVEITPSKSVKKEPDDDNAGDWATEYTSDYSSGGKAADANTDATSGYAG